MSIINNVFLTMSLKIHNPSTIKQRIMDQAMLRYSMALQTMLDYAEQKIDEIRHISELGGKNKSKILQLLDKSVLRELNKFNVEPFKDSLKIDFTNLLESYIKRKKKSKKATFPAVFTDGESLLKYIEDRAPERRNTDRLINKLWAAKSVYFCRYSEKRDFSLLYNSDKKKFYAKLYLLNQHDELKHKPIKSQNSQLKVVGKDMLLPKSNRPERFIIVPLSFGKAQEKYLVKALNTPNMIRTARLVKKDSGYYLMINIAIEPVSCVETENFAGFHMLNDGRFSYTICDHNGKVLNRNFLNCGIHKNDHVESENLHIMANSIVELCEKYRAQAILESYPLYNKLAEILNYKLPLKGLQKPVRVSPFGLWQTCPKCGYNCRKNNSLRVLFLCTACGFGIDLNHLPSHNLSKRLLKYSSDKVRFTYEKNENGKGFIIKNKLLNIEYHGFSDDIDSFFEHIKVRTDEVRDYLEHRVDGWSKKEKRVYSLWNKLLMATDLREVIEINLPY